MKAVDVKPSMYIDFNKENNKESPNFKIGDNVTISKYKDMSQIWSEEVFVIKNIKNTVPWTNVFSDLEGEEIVGTFYKKELQKTKQK